MERAPSLGAPVVSVPVEAAPAVPVESVPVSVEPTPVVPAHVIPAPGYPSPVIAAQVAPAQAAITPPARAVPAETRTPGARRRSGPTPLMIGLMSGGGVLLIGLVIGLAMILNGGANRGVGGGAAVANNSRAAAGAQGASASGLFGGAPAGSGATIVLKSEELDKISLQVDGIEQSLASPEIAVPAGAHRLVLRRRGYEMIEHALNLQEGERREYAPEWRVLEAPGLAANGMPAGGGVSRPSLPGPSLPGPSLSGPALAGASRAGGASTAPMPPGIWLQNIDIARERARQANRDVLVFFLGSDWSEDSQRVAQTLDVSPVETELKSKFEVVRLEYPVTREARAMVHQLEANIRMLGQYGVDPEQQIPLALAMDVDGLVYARVANPGAKSPLLTELEAAQSARSDRDQYFARTERGTPAERLEAAGHALLWLKDRDLWRYYGERIRGWRQLAESLDPGNNSGKVEPFFVAAIFVGLQEAQRDRSPDGIILLQELERWHRERRFKDPNVAARAMILAAVAAAQGGSAEGIQTMVAAGNSYQPSDPEVVEMLDTLQRLIDKASELSSGTGFVIAPGIVLTNAHVVEGGRRLVIRRPGVDQDLAARTIAIDKERDIALVRCDDIQVDGLSLSANALGRGASVAAFGYPLGDAIGGGLKLTTGVVSALPEKANEGMLLLDMRVNPGNSGGPLCDAKGRVVAMVTAKTQSDELVDTYGMAIPAADLLDFLKQHLSDYQPVAPPDGEFSGWDSVDQAVSPAVVMIVALES